MAIVRRTARRVRREVGLWRLRRRAGTSRQIARAIRAAFRHRMEPEERVWVNRIEGVRKELETSRRVLEKTDYGAGDPQSPRSRQESSAGVTVTGSIGEITRVSSKPARWCRLLFHLVRTVRPRTPVEMGTSVGISGCYQAAAMELNGRGRLVTLEGSESVAAVARTTFARLGLHRVEVVTGRFQDSLEGVLEREAPVEYLFVDGHHDGDATLEYFTTAMGHLPAGAMVVFDDIRWSPDMNQAWETIIGDERVSVSVDLGAIGLCVVDAGGPGLHLRIDF